METTQKENSGNSDVINVVEQFDYSTQYEEYNQKFIAWRKRKNNPFAFTFSKNNRESVYVEGRGFIETSRKDAEKQILTGIFNVLGIAMLIWVFCDNILKKALIKLMAAAGMDIDVNLYNSIISGGSREVAYTIILFGFLTVFLPLIYINKKLKMPRQAAVMSRLNDPGALFGSISAAFLVCIAASIPNAYSTDTSEILGFFKADNIDFLIWDQSEFILYTFFNVIFMPILTQLLFCGPIFTAMRQFGDKFAVLMTSVSAALLSLDLRSMPGIFLITLIGCTGMLNSGTVFTAISVNIIYKMYDLTIALFETNDSEYMPIMRNSFMLALGIIGTAGIILYRLHIKKKNIHFADYSSEIPFRARILFSARAFPYPVVAIICLISAAMEVLK